MSDMSWDEILFTILGKLGNREFFPPAERSPWKDKGTQLVVSTHGNAGNGWEGDAVRFRSGSGFCWVRVQLKVRKLSKARRHC